MEDLEELEVQSAIAAYKALTIALQSTGPSGLPPGWKRIPRDDQGHYQVTVSSQTLKPCHHQVMIPSQIIKSCHCQVTMPSRTHMC